MKLDETIAAVVTGGASGLGAATSRRLADRGVRVAILDIEADVGEALAKEIGGVFCQANVGSSDEIDAALAKARAANGQERILVNCAGISGRGVTLSRDAQTGEIKEYPLEVFERVVQINLIGTFRCITKCAAGMLTLPVLEDGDRGAIVNTASIAAHDGQIGQVAYTAAKAGVVGMTLNVARDLSSEAIRVNTILPGMFDTPMMARSPEDVRGRLLASVPFPCRLGSPEEFAQLAETMITNGYLNGENVRLDGGLRMAPR